MACLSAALLSLAFIGWSNFRRIQRVEYITNVAPWSVERPQVDPQSPTGYANGRRQLIVPEHNNDSYEWIAQTQQMLATGEWRLRRVDYDNAPHGRHVQTASPYRWWLAFIAGAGHAAGMGSLGIAVEHAALWADPLIQLIAVVGLGIFTLRHIGALSATVVIFGWVMLFPLAGSFLAGAPDSRGLVCLCIGWTILPILAAFRAAFQSQPAARDRRVRRLFALSAIAGGLGLWVSVDEMWPVITAVALSGLAMSWIGRRWTLQVSEMPWRLWGLAGCGVSLAAYCAEYFPNHVSARINGNHPLFALSWLGAAALIHWLAGWFRGSRQVDRLFWATMPFFLLAALAAPVSAIWTGGRGWISHDPRATHVGAEQATAAAAMLGEWALNERSLVYCALLPPICAVILGIYIIMRRGTDPSVRAPLCIGTIVSIALLPLVFLQLRTACFLDVISIALFAAACAASRISIVLRLAPAALACLLGLGLLWPESPTEGRFSLRQVEVQGLIERDLAQWISRREPAAIVIAPPDLTTSIYFHGGLRGLGTFDRENEAGLSAALRIIGATSSDEALGLIRNRGVTHVIIPSWDSFLEKLAGMASSRSENSFHASLVKWSAPDWVRPVPYIIPPIDGMTPQQAAVFEVVAPQDAAAALSRTVEYLIEMGQQTAAAGMLPRLRQFPANLGAQVALTQAAISAGDRSAALAGMDAILSLLEAGAGRRMPWDRRVSLAIVLAQAKRADLAREQVDLCWKTASEEKVRSLSGGSLFGLVMLTSAWKLAPESEMWTLARGLLPPDRS